jgi:hypothetical protein
MVDSRDTTLEAYNYRTTDYLHTGVVAGQANGVAQRRNGELVRFGKQPPSERHARQIAAGFEHTHRKA